MMLPAHSPGAPLFLPATACTFAEPRVPSNLFIQAPPAQLPLWRPVQATQVQFMLERTPQKLLNLDLAPPLVHLAKGEKSIFPLRDSFTFPYQKAWQPAEKV